MGILVTILHICVAIFLILVVLLQTGKRADLAGAFGGGGSQTAFGARGAATFLTKLTAGSVVVFMILLYRQALAVSRIIDAYAQLFFRGARNYPICRTRSVVAALLRVVPVPDV